MRIKRKLMAIGAGALILAASRPLDAQNIRGREVLGVRLGGVIAQGAFSDEFGSGSEIELHFIHGIANWLGVDVSLSSHNFGESKNREKNILFTGLDREVDLQVFSVSAGMIALKRIRGRFTPTVEAGPGFYNVNTTLFQGFYEARKTDNHLGLYGGIGLVIKLTNSLSLNANGKYHHVFVGTDPEDTIHFFTDESGVRFYQITLGIMITTG